MCFRSIRFLVQILRSNVHAPSPRFTKIVRFAAFQKQKLNFIPNKTVFQNVLPRTLRPLQSFCLNFFGSRRRTLRGGPLCTSNEGYVSSQLPQLIVFPSFFCFSEVEIRKYSHSTVLLTLVTAFWQCRLELVLINLFSIRSGELFYIFSLF